MKLKALIGRLKRELHEAAARDDDALFTLGECEIEVAVAIEAKGEAGLDFTLLGAGARAGGGGGRTRTSTLKIRLQPIAEKQDPLSAWLRSYRPAAPGGVVRFSGRKKAGANRFDRVMPGLLGIADGDFDPAKLTVDDHLTLSDGRVAAVLSPPRKARA